MSPHKVSAIGINPNCKLAAVDENRRMTTHHTDPPASQEDIERLKLAATARYTYLGYIGWLAGKLEAEPVQYAQYAARELRHIATTNLSGFDT